jgi:hypothetical protein
MSARSHCLGALVCVALVAATADAQVRTTGQIVGVVRDASGAVVANADVEIKEIGTGITANATSARDGAFVFPAVQPGRYLLTAAIRRLKNCPSAAAAYWSSRC